MCGKLHPQKNDAQKSHVSGSHTAQAPSRITILKAMD